MISERDTIGGMSANSKGELRVVVTTMSAKTHIFYAKDWKPGQPFKAPGEVVVLLVDELKRNGTIVYGDETEAVVLPQHAVESVKVDWYDESSQQVHVW